MYEVYMWNRNTNNKIFIASFSTSEEAEKLVRERMSDAFVYYIKVRKNDKSD